MKDLNELANLLEEMSVKIDKIIKDLSYIDIRNIEEFKCIKCHRVSTSAVKKYIPVCVECRNKYSWQEQEWKNATHQKY